MTEEKNLMSRIDDIVTKYGKDAAFGYSLSVIEQMIKKPKENDEILSCKEITKSIPRPFSPKEKEPEDNKEKELGKKIIPTNGKQYRKRNAAEIKTCIIQCLRLNSTGLNIGDIHDYINLQMNKNFEYSDISNNLRRMAAKKLLDDSEMRKVAGKKESKIFKLMPDLNGNVTIKNNRAEAHD